MRIELLGQLRDIQKMSKLSVVERLMLRWNGGIDAEHAICLT